MSAITDAAQALAGLLRTAEDGDLPMPSSAEALAYAPTSESEAGTGGITMLVRSLEDLADWSTFLDSPIDDSTVFKDRVHCRVDGMAGPVPVRVTALVPVAESVSA